MTTDDASPAPSAPLIATADRVGAGRRAAAVSTTLAVIVGVAALLAAFIGYGFSIPPDFEIVEPCPRAVQAGLVAICAVVTLVSVAVLLLVRDLVRRGSGRAVSRAVVTWIISSSLWIGVVCYLAVVLINVSSGSPGQVPCPL